MFQKEVIIFGRKIDCFVLTYKVLFSSFCPHIHLLLLSYLKIVYSVLVFSFSSLMLSWALKSAILNLNNSASVEKNMYVYKNKDLSNWLFTTHARKKPSEDPKPACISEHMYICMSVCMTSFQLSFFFPNTKSTAIILIELHFHLAYEIIDHFLNFKKTWILSYNVYYFCL